MVMRMVQWSGGWLCSGQDGSGQDGAAVKVVPVSLMYSAAILIMSSFVFLLVHFTLFSCSHFLSKGAFTLEICAHRV